MQGYFLARPVAIKPSKFHAIAQDAVRLAKHERNSSPESMSSTRSFLRPEIITPPSSRTVSFSHWTRFNTSPISTPTGELKASVLCEASEITPDYDPPVSEWTFLGANQPVFEYQPGVKKSAQRRQKSPSSWTAMSSQDEAITFEKEPIKRVSTSSQLTASLRSSSLGSNPEANKFGLSGTTCEELPSAFDSDSEGEDSE
ncbi:hypothetical protein EK21DRAFT_118155 [Setomelanomma holmii]|uniref:Uncharacterized protein n=1 Tax=Setomelanomma holmii TaxID=210430 RepID=A0A9P4GZL9_9PLEO|nr:hypothetical protein EK21DRAFT_118155 [Setomelanomma holmii]